MNFLFDLYGTLADIWTDEEKKTLWCGFAELLGESDYELVKAEYHAICKRYSDAREHKLVEFDLLLVFEEMLRSRGIEKDKAPEFARLFRLLSRERLQLFPCIVEILEGLKERGAGVYLVSNAQSCFTRDELDELGIARLFDGILISSEAGVKKPDVGIFHVAFEKFGIEGQKNYYVGNDLHDDVLGASRAGLSTVYIETQQSGRYSDLAVAPDYTVSTHYEMMTQLFELAEGKK